MNERYIGKVPADSPWSGDLGLKGDVTLLPVHVFVVHQASTLPLIIS